MNRQPPDTPEAFTPEPPVCTIDDRLFYRLQWLIYGGVGVLVAAVVLAIYKALRSVLLFVSSTQK